MNIVTGAMGSLIPKLGELLVEEYKLHKHVRKDVEFLTKELESMHAALIKVGEVPPDQLDRQVKLWANEVRELSYNMEDVVDKFIVRVHGVEPDDNTNGFKGLMKRTTKLLKKVVDKHGIAHAIKDIKKELQEVAARRDRNKFDGIASTPSEAIDPRLRALYIEAAELVGIYGKRDQGLMSLLSLEGDDASTKKLKKVSIVGFGGLGKTTLAKAVYEKIKGDFDCRAFVPVGQNPDMKKVLRDILIDLGNPHSDLAMLDANQLTKKIGRITSSRISI
ncbi:disease resistance protein Pik-2-like [Triticum urartu]|uniref:disease resistance protein Pik-2-like n=1 Tax=Triticum urartu TaxID=4572 RepID=UPI002043FF14|nr:disease resistance protein Pik-2-like [Triticum urartu]XP_048562689.1 disease resistance protein Pik-2-like [Triticum urartu]